jgi:hypothetical protein
MKGSPRGTFNAAGSGFGSGSGSLFEQEYPNVQKNKKDIAKRYFIRI